MKAEKSGDHDATPWCPDCNFSKNENVQNWGTKKKEKKRDGSMWTFEDLWTLPEKGKNLGESYYKQ